MYPRVSALSGQWIDTKSGRADRRAGRPRRRSRACRRTRPRRGHTHADACAIDATRRPMVPSPPTRPSVQSTKCAIPPGGSARRGRRSAPDAHLRRQAARQRHHHRDRNVRHRLGGVGGQVGDGDISRRRRLERDIVEAGARLADQLDRRRKRGDQIGRNRHLLVDHDGLASEPLQYLIGPGSRRAASAPPAPAC